jgi:hypothetical protein
MTFGSPDFMSGFNFSPQPGADAGRIGRAQPQECLQLRVMAIEEDTTVQALAGEAAPPAATIPALVFPPKPSPFAMSVLSVGCELVSADKRALCRRPISWRATATRPRRPVGGACRSDGRPSGVRSNPFDSALCWSWPRLQFFGPVEPHGVVDQQLALKLGRGRDARDHVDEVTVIGNVRFHVGVRPVGAP